MLHSIIKPFFLANLLSAHSAQVACFLLINLPKTHIFWMLKQMPNPKNIFAVYDPKPVLVKMMGSGKGGFGIVPDWNRYLHFSLWPDLDAAQHFLATHPLVDELHQKTNQLLTILAHPLQSRGLWDGQNPFVHADIPITPNQPLLALTRASIRWLAIPSFWKNVPKTAEAIKHAPGLLMAQGMGELPLVRQATLSLWQNAECLSGYAYKQHAHKQIVVQTRIQKWYSEELFARFAPIYVAGKWNDFDAQNFSVV